MIGFTDFDVESVRSLNHTAMFLVQLRKSPAFRVPLLTFLSAPVFEIKAPEVYSSAGCSAGALKVLFRAALKVVLNGAQEHINSKITSQGWNFKPTEQ
jgi:hypothetical protein